mmetsp:Transcript_8375/g.29773  ORF Transcript_8375/g.29773 Transcript_8375/m.29773 type:complete len:811 (-) Transcript_8375:72-2504(-)
MAALEGLGRVSPKSRLRRALQTTKTATAASTIVGTLASSTLQKVVAVLSKSPAGRSSDEIKYVVKFLVKRREELKFFAHKSPEILEQLARHLAVSTYNPGVTVFRQGEVGDKLYVVVEGSVGVYLKKDSEASLTRRHSKGHHTKPRRRASSHDRDSAATVMTPEMAEAAEAERVAQLERAVRRSSEALNKARRSISEAAPHRHSVVGSGVSPGAGSPIMGSLQRSMMAKKRWKKAGGILFGVRMAKMVSAGKAEPLTEVLEVEKGQCFGEMALQDPRPTRRAATVKAKEKTICFTLDKDTYLRIGGPGALQQTSGNLADYHRFIKSLPLFAGLEPEALVRLTYGIHEWTAPRGTVVAKSGEKLTGLSIVRSGSCSILVPSPIRGQAPLVLGVVGTGECLGEKCVLLDQDNDFTVVTDTETLFLTVPDAEFKRHRTATEAAIFETVLAKQDWHLGRMQLLHEQRRKQMEGLPVPLMPPHAVRPIGRPVPAFALNRTHEPRHVPRTLDRLGLGEDAAADDDDAADAGPALDGRPFTAAAAVGPSARAEASAASARGGGSGQPAASPPHGYDALPARALTAPAGARRPARAATGGDVAEAAPRLNLAPTRPGEPVPMRAAWAAEDASRAAASAGSGARDAESGDARGDSSSGEESAAVAAADSARSTSSAVAPTDFFAAMQAAAAGGGSVEEQLFRDAGGPGGAAAGSRRGSRRASAGPTAAAGGGGGGGKRKNKQMSWDQVIAAEERAARQAELARMDKLVGHSRRLIVDRPPTYDWEREVQPLRGDFRYDRITAQPLRRKAIKKFVGGRKR